MITTIFMLAVVQVPQDWYTFAPAGKNFRVELPTRPASTSSRTINNAAGRAQLTAAQSNTSDAIYSIQVTENRGKVDPKTLDDGIRRFSADKRAVLGAVKTITVDGNPGREFEMTETSDGGQLHSRIRWVTSGNTLIMLMAAGKPGTEIPDNADRFLGSLKIGSVNVADGTPTPAEAIGKGSETRAGMAKTAPKAADQKPAEKAKVTTRGNLRDPNSYPDEALEDLSRSYLGKDRDGFRDVGPVGSVLVGVRVSYIQRFGGPKVRSAQPIYRSGTTLVDGRIHGEVVGPVTTVVAKPGYAVGGLVTHTGLTVDGFRMVFMKINGDRLDLEDTYNSTWIGDEKGGNPGDVTSKGALVVGLQGRSGKEVFALGLTTLK
jgi:hypothetical protein